MGLCGRYLRRVCGGSRRCCRWFGPCVEHARSGCAGLSTLSLAPQTRRKTGASRAIACDALSACRAKLKNATSAMRARAVSVCGGWGGYANQAPRVHAKARCSAADG